jgi:phospholipid/cholesterol/gamma-HCH transport system substrate-binding protein
MTSKSTEIKVGITVIAAAAVLALGVIWIEDMRFNRKWQNYSVYFEEVGGLSPGDPVAVAGLELGKVEAIVLENGRVRADLLIEQGVVLRDDLKVEIRSIGLMGEKFVYILPGTDGGILDPGIVVDGQYKAGLPEVVAGMGDIMDEMKQAAESLNKIVAAEGTGVDIAQSIAQLNELGAELLEVLRENRADVRTSTRAMRRLSTNLDTLVDDRKDEIAGGIETFASAAARLDSITVRLTAMVDQVESGDGTLGKLVREDDLHREIEEAARNLNLLIKDIKEHPERYIHIEIF